MILENKLPIQESQKRPGEIKFGEPVIKKRSPLKELYNEDIGTKQRLLREEQRKKLGGKVKNPKRSKVKVTPFSIEK